MKKFLFPLFIAAVSLSLCACTPPNDDPQLLFQDAWVRAIPPGSKMTAGFGLLDNPGHVNLEVVAFNSPEFGNVSLHQTVTEEGVSRMQGVPELTIEAGAGLKLVPGGYHLMLMRPVTDISETVSINIELSTGEIFSFKLPVERR